MKIGVDITPLQREQTGVGYYSLALLAPMVEQRPHDTFILYSYQQPPELQQLAKFKNVILATPQRNAISSTPSFTARVQMRAYRLRPVDIYWSVTQCLPRIICARRTVLTVHDFFHFICPEMVFKPQLQRLLRNGGRSIHQADAVVANSHGTAAMIQERHGVRATAVVWPPVRPFFQPSERSFLAQFLAERQLSDRGYALSIATLEPRKNLDRLLSAYLDALGQYGPDRCIPLVLIGKTESRSTPLLSRLREAIERYPTHIRFAGRVDDQEVIAYLSGARSLFLVSRYEGYGMPLAEARACGTPVVSTDIPEMREAAQNDGLFLQLNELEQQLAPLFCKDTPPFTVQKATYPTAEELALQMGKVFDDFKL